MNKALTTTEFVLWLEKQQDHIANDEPGLDFSHEDFYFMLIKYASIMQQPLELGMFVPCVDGKLLVDPNDSVSEESFPHDVSTYGNAKEQVLFEGCTVDILDGDVGIDLIIGERIVQRIYWNQKETLEHVVRTVSFKPTKAFLNKIGL